jgi:hypothetical protein
MTSKVSMPLLNAHEARPRVPATQRRQRGLLPGRAIRSRVPVLWQLAQGVTAGVARGRRQARWCIVAVFALQAWGWAHAAEVALTADPVEARAQAAFKRCAAAYNRNPTHGADRAFMRCHEAQRGVYDAAQEQVWQGLATKTPEACHAAVQALRQSMVGIAAAQQVFADAMTTPRPGQGEADAALLKSVAAAASYRLAKALADAIERRLDNPPSCTPALP